MNIPRQNLARPVLVDGWLTDIGGYAAKAGRSLADIWGRATAPTVVTTETDDKTPLYLGLAGVGLLGAFVLMRKGKRKGRRA